MLHGSISDEQTRKEKIIRYCQNNFKEVKRENLEEYCECLFWKMYQNQIQEFDNNNTAAILKLKKECINDLNFTSMDLEVSKISGYDYFEELYSRLDFSGSEYLVLDPIDFANMCLENPEFRNIIYNVLEYPLTLNDFHLELSKNYKLLHDGDIYKSGWVSTIKINPSLVIEKIITNDGIGEIKLGQKFSNVSLPLGYYSEFVKEENIWNTVPTYNIYFKDGLQFKVRAKYDRNKRRYEPIVGSIIIENQLYKTIENISTETLLRDFLAMSKDCKFSRIYEGEFTYHITCKDNPNIIYHLKESDRVKYDPCIGEQCAKPFNPYDFSFDSKIYCIQLLL